MKLETQEHQVMKGSAYETDEIIVESVDAHQENHHIFCKKLPKHMKEIHFDNYLGPETQYAMVRLELPDGSETQLKGKVDTGAQVNLLNYATFKKIFGEENRNILHESHVKLTGYRGKKFTNHGKFRLDKVHHNKMTGRRVKFYVSDFGSNLFSLRFCKALKIIKVLCDQPGACKDCSGNFDIAEVQPKYKKTVQKPIKVESTQQVIEEAKDVFTGTGKLNGYKYQIQIDDSVPPVVCPPR